MRFSVIIAAVSYFCTLCTAKDASIKGIEALVRRRLPNHIHDFSFSLVNVSASEHSNVSTQQNDVYTVSDGANQTISISGNTPIALASGLRWYLANVVHVDIYWFIGSRLHLAPTTLPRLNETHTGSSVVPWRYHFNTVTFSYTAAFWTWEDWELQLDWMALRGINLPLAWVGQEKILLDVFLDAGFTQAEAFSYFSGPAFQGWNRFGNIQGSWGGELPMSWVDSQFALQKKIIARMVELGMTPVLPCFTGFVPRAIDRVYPDAAFVNGSAWEDFPSSLTNVTFLEPTDALFADLQASFISKQAAAYGNVSSIYTLDYFNENEPAEGTVEYLRNVSRSTWKSLKNADSDAVWMMQGWLFYSNSAFWSNERIEAFLSGVEDDSDMLILDLFSESAPQWQRTDSYYGKPWIWCQLHDYGGNMGLYGQVENVTYNPIEALSNSTTLVGFGLTMEGQEGNEIMYDILLDQAWSAKPLDIDVYFHDWVTARYAGNGTIPHPVYEAWDIMRTTVYNNTDLTTATAVTKSIFELSPNTTGLVNRTGHHATTIQYAQADLVRAWQLLYAATTTDALLWDNPAFVFDLVDVTRQVLANAFTPLYESFVLSANSSSSISSNSTQNTTTSYTSTATAGLEMIKLLRDLDSVLTASGIAHFSLAAWIDSARAWARDDNKTSSSSSSSSSWSTPSTFSPPLSTALSAAKKDNSSTTTTTTTTIAKVAQEQDEYEYNARNQITLWGPSGQVTDYASKQWGGLVSSYYVPRWQMFVDSLLLQESGGDEDAVLSARLLAFGETWDQSSWGGMGVEGDLAGVMAGMVAAWPEVFSF